MSHIPAIFTISS